MNIHEYQAKAVLQEFGVPVSRGMPIFRDRTSPHPSRILR